jgi:hypothetical protein
MITKNWGVFFIAYSCFCLLFIGSAFLSPLYAKENVPVFQETPRLNNENWDTISHPKVASFTVHEDGSAEGLTVTNVPFKQYTIFDKNGIRAQRFEIQDHYHYIVQGEIAYSDEELTRLLARYTKTQIESM